MIRIKNRRGETTYAMGPDVIDAFKHNEAFVPAEPKLLTCDELFCEIYSLFESRVYDYCSMKNLFQNYSVCLKQTEILSL